MNKGLWIARKNYLFCLMRKVFEANGGDNVEVFKQNFEETLAAHDGEKIEAAIACYKKIIETWGENEQEA